MSFITNLIIFNPLEALLLILFVNIYQKNRVTQRDIPFIMLLSAVNLLVQSVNVFLRNEIAVFIYDVAVSLLFMPIILYFVYVYAFKKIPKVFECFMAGSFNFVTIFIALYLAEKFSVCSVSFNIEQGLFSKLFCNTFIKVVQYTLLTILKLGAYFYEKVSKEDCIQKH